MKSVSIARLAAPTLTLLILLATPILVRSSEFRSIDGSGNNLGNPDFGRANIELIRLHSDTYDDHVSVPRGGANPSSLPGARWISSSVSAQQDSVTNFLGASDWLWQWGQFVDHDIDLTPGASIAEPFPIQVPQVGDRYFNPSELANVSIPFNRSMAAPGTGTSATNPRQQFNAITSYLDASMIYGSDSVRAAALRNSVNPSMLETSLSAGGEVLPMKNTLALPNDNGGSNNSELYYLSGDVRANEQIGLTATHSLFVREHNRIVRALDERLAAGETTLVASRQAAIDDHENAVNSEHDFLYESARQLVGAQIQQITYEEFLPVLIGNQLGDYRGYDATIDASISNEFATAAYRLGHTLLSSQIQRPGVGAIALQDAFFNPNEVHQKGVDSVLLGLARQEAQQLDHLLVDDLRNFLFGPPGAGGLDLASLNIQRGRDHGLPGYTATYADIFGQSITSFSELGSSGFSLFADDVVAMLQEAYPTVDAIDLWIGGISELPDSHGGLLGPTFSHFLIDQFGRTRDGDRFFYQSPGTAEQLQLLDPALHNTRLSDIILRNSSIASIQPNVFMAEVPEPATLALITTGLLAVGLRRQCRCLYGNRTP